MKHIFLSIVLLLFACASFAQTRQLKLVDNPNIAAVRKAIVIGESAYGDHNTLDNTVNDANDMAATFTQLGFEVTKVIDANEQSLNEKLRLWYKTITNTDVAVFYFAGHGAEIDGVNYLIPVGGKFELVADVTEHAIKADEVITYMDGQNVKLKLMILDACRTNEFNKTRGRSTGGLVGMDAPKGTYIAFAAAPKQAAIDGGIYGFKNGVFTHFLKTELLKPGVSLDGILTNVANDVDSLTNGKQFPYRNVGVTKRFYFIPRSPGDNPVPYNPSPAPAPAVDVAELVNQADAYYKNGLYRNAVQLYKQAAEKGNAYAQYKLGYCFYHSDGVKQDTVQAFYWFKNAVEWYKGAAEQGNVDAQDILGYYYLCGLGGVKKDFGQAMDWYRKAAEGYKKAAEQNDAHAQYMLGIYYIVNYKLGPDFDQVIKWLTKAAEQGNVDAQYELGFYYMDGFMRIVKQDYNQAIYWYRKAAEQGNAKAQLDLGRYYSYKDDNQAVYWYRKAADQGEPFAQCSLGSCYYLGQGVAKDYDRAVEWYRKAAEQENGYAEYSLGRCYYYGNGVAKNNDQAVEWYKKAVKHGDFSAKYELNKLGIKYQ